MTSVLDQIADSTRQLSKKQKVELVGRIVKDTPLSNIEKSRLIAMIAGELLQFPSTGRGATGRIRHLQRLLELMPTTKGRYWSRAEAEKKIPDYARLRKLAVDEGKSVTLYEGEFLID